MYGFKQHYEKMVTKHFGKTFAFKSSSNERKCVFGDNKGIVKLLFAWHNDVFVCRIKKQRIREHIFLQNT